MAEIKNISSVNSNSISSLNIAKFEDILKMEISLRKKNRELQILVAQMEHSLLLKCNQKNDSSKNLNKKQHKSTSNTDCCTDNIFHKHLKDTEERYVYLVRILFSCETC